MKRKDLFKKVLTLLVFILIVPLSKTFVIAETGDLVKPEEWGVDRNISTQSPNYMAINQIHIVEVPLSSDYFFENDKLLVRTIYYHYVFKLGYPEPIFNILITPSGQVWELTVNGLDSQISHDKQKGLIVIGITTNEVTKVDRNLQQITDQVLNVASTFGLSESDLFASEFRLNYSKPPTVSLLPSKNIDLGHLVETIKSNIKGKIKPLTPQIELSANTINIEANPAQLAEVFINIKNRSQIAIYGGKSQSIYVGTVEPTNRNSPCFDSNTWFSPNRTGIVESERINPNSDGTIRFKCKVKLMPGEYQEKFALVTNKGYWIENTNFTVNVKVMDIGQKVLQIRETGLGYLNIRQNPATSAPIIGTAGVGEQFLFDEYNNGFYRIKIDDKYGWVSSQYVNILKN